MSTFELYRHPVRDTVAVKRGFSWPGFLLTWAWTASQQLWVASVVLLALMAGMAWIALGLVEARGMFIGCALGGLGLIAGIAGNDWRVRRLQREGYEYLGSFEAVGPAQAVQRLAVVGGVIPEEWRTQRTATGLIQMPQMLQQLFAMAWLTCKAAWRFRLFPLLAAVLLITVIGLPLVIKDDGSARGLIQILITYTLGLVSTILGFCTLWLACGTLARDVEECQLQVVAVKPIPRWQIWLGKWLGLMVINAALLGLAGLAVFFLVQWRAARLNATQQTILRNELLVARASAREPVPDFNRAVEGLIAQRQKEVKIEESDLPTVRKELRERVRQSYQIVQPGYLRRWTVDLGVSPERLRGQTMHIRIKFASSQVTGSPTPYLTTWVVGPVDSPRRASLQKRLTNDTFHELAIPPDMLNEKGELVVDFVNRNPIVLLFAPEDSLEVLYREGGFGLNFCRSLAVLYLWLGALAALGLAAASYLSFPVAAFLALSLLVAGLSSGMVETVLKEGSLMGGAAATMRGELGLVDFVFLPLLRGLLAASKLVLDFSPIDALSTGRSVTWGVLGRAFVHIWLLAGGVVGVIGIFIFSRRELASGQATQ